MLTTTTIDAMSDEILDNLKASTASFPREELTKLLPAFMSICAYTDVPEFKSAAPEDCAAIPKGTILDVLMLLSILVTEKFTKQELLDARERMVVMVLEKQSNVATKQ